MNKTEIDAGKSNNIDRNNYISRFILHPNVTNPISQTEQPKELKLALGTQKRSKHEFIPGCLRNAQACIKCFQNSILTRPVIKESGLPNAKVHNSAITYFRTKEEGSTVLWVYGQAILYDRITERNINHHIKLLTKKIGGVKDIMFHQADKTLGASSVKSNLSKSITARKFSKLKTIQFRYKSVTTSQEEQAKTINTPLKSIGKQPRLASEIYGYQRQRYINSVNETGNPLCITINATKNLVTSAVIKEENAQPLAEEFDLNLQAASFYKPIQKVAL